MHIQRDPRAYIGHILSLWTVCACLSAGAVSAAGDGGKVSPLFQSHEPLSLRISAPFSQFIRGRGSERPYVPAMLTFTDENGAERQLELKIRVRGKSRANPETCSFPPLMLNFSRKKLDGTPFADENKLKLVTHCQNKSAYENYVRLEYLNYRVFQLFTDHSVRVRLAQINYRDSENDKDLGVHTAFFLEDSGRMARRLGMKQIRETRLAPQIYDPASLNLVEVFAYFLGNVDWSAVRGPEGEDCCHNIIPLRDASGKTFPVPYDFDSTGVVDAPYAPVPKSLSIDSVRQRLYRGFCHGDGILQGTLQLFEEKRGAITDLYQSQADLSPRSASSALNYYGIFYKTIGTPGSLEREIVNKCRDMSG